jgi:TatD DNase family protein
MVRGFAERGAYFSFNGGFLDSRKTLAREAFKLVPVERLLVETDAPAMLLPREHQRHTLPPTADGQPVNHPGNLAAGYAGLAELRGLTVEALAAQVEQNFARLFGPAPPPA